MKWVRACIGTNVFIMKKEANNMRNLFIIVGIFFLAGCQTSVATLPLDNLEMAIQQSKQTNRPILAIFDLWGSSNKWVDSLLTDRVIQQQLVKYVVVRLRCDDKKNYTDSLSIGQHNAQLQKTLTGETYQPMLCLLDVHGKLVLRQIGYTSKETVLSFLKKKE
jgi:hypothetical protein